MNKRKSSETGSYTDLQEPLYGEIKNSFEEALARCTLEDAEASNKEKEPISYSIDPFTLRSYENLTKEMNKSFSHAEEQDADLRNQRPESLSTFSKSSKSLVNLPPATGEREKFSLMLSSEKLRQNSERNINTVRIVTLTENYGPSASIPIQKYVSSTREGLNVPLVFQV